MLILLLMSAQLNFSELNYSVSNHNGEINFFFLIFKEAYYLFAIIKLFFKILMI